MKNKIFLLLLLISCLFLSGCGPTKTAQMIQTSPTAAPTRSPTKGGEAGVPLPTGEDVIRAFFELINEKKIPDAISMMDKSMVPDDSTKQAYGVTFNRFSSVKVKSIEQCNPLKTLPGYDCYQVTLDIEITPSSDLILWDTGENTRWVDLKKVDNVWKISQISTGP